MYPSDKLGTDSVSPEICPNEESGVKASPFDKQNIDTTSPEICPNEGNGVKSSPFISVLIVVYNGEKYLDTCLDSALSQDYGNYEVVAVNDGSTDGTADVLDRRAAADSRLRVRHCPHNGLSATRKIAVGESRGEYLISVDADDEMSQNYLKTVAEEIVKGNYDVVGTDYRMTYENSSRVVERHYYAPGRVLTGYDHLKEVFSFRKNPMLSIYAIRRTLMDNIDYPPEFWTYEDTFIQAQVGMQCPTVKHIPFISYTYFQRKSSVSHQLPPVDYVAMWCGRMRSLIYSAEGLSEDDKQLYALLCDIQNYFAYVSHSRNSWRGDIDFAVSIRAGIRQRESEVLKFHSLFCVTILKLDEYRWLRPLVLTMLAFRRWRLSIKKKTGRLKYRILLSHC